MPSPVYTFASREVISSSKFNTNFAVLTQCVAKSGDTLTGTLNVRGLIPTTSVTYPLGSSSLLFSDAFIKTLKLSDSNDSHTVAISITSNITANRTLSLVTGDTDRTLTLSGNPTLADWFDQSVKQAASPTFTNLNLSGTLDTAGNTVKAGTSATVITTAAGLLKGAAIDSVANFATGIILPARLGANSPTASTVLYGDSTWRAPAVPDELLKGNSGTSTAGTPVNLDTVTVTNLTVKDRLRIRATLVMSAGETCPSPIIYNNTNGANIMLSPIGATTTENQNNIFEWIVSCNPSVTTSFIATQSTSGAGSGGAGTIEQAFTTQATAFTAASLTIALRSQGVSAGTLSWSWTVVKEAGQ